MISYSKLNEAQKEAVIDENKHLRIIAGAGSGKTRVLTMRIAYLIEQKNIRPYNILAITFTNKAAKEMKKRVNEMLEEDATGVFISTIHSLCMRILSEEIDALNYPKNFTVIDSDDQRSILKEAYKEIGIDKKDYSYGVILDYIANNKYMHIEASEAIKQAYGDERLIKKALVYEYYQNRLHNMYGLDFDDLILFTTKLFKLYPLIQEKWSKKFYHVLVDEFQDIDKEQYILIKQLCSYHDNLYVVGDPDQTIFTWRGADVNIIVNLDKDFPDTKTILLTENYRSTNNILKGANSVIKYNKARVDKELYSNKGDGEKIIHKSLKSQLQEAYYVVNRIKELHEDGYNYQDIAILYRSNYLSREIEKVLIENKIAYVIYGGLRYYERAEIKDILSYLRMITKNDDLAFMRIINNPRRGIGQKTVDNILLEARKNDITMYEVVKNKIYDPHKPSLDQFIKMIEKWKEDANKLDLENLLQEVLNDSGYKEMLEKENETERLENIKSLIDDIVDYEETNPENTLDDYLQMISLYTDRVSDEASNAVNLLTIHSAKGLEFPIIFVIGLSEGIFPSEKTMQEGIKGLEEERRLAYVAYTRAKDLLYLSDAGGFSYVTGANKLPSRFIDEIDDNCINHLDEINDYKKSLIFDEDIKPFNISKINNQTEYHNGDNVIHQKFGEGIIIGKDDNILIIAFPHPHGIKRIFASHPSIRKKNNDNYS